MADAMEQVHYYPYEVLHFWERGGGRQPSCCCMRWHAPGCADRANNDDASLLERCDQGQLRWRVGRKRGAR
jgi:hypothetical protein